MKLLCTFLILAGVFALNDASMSYEAHMRIFHDKMKLNDLKRVALYRDLDSSVQCSQDLLAFLTEILTAYNSDVAACNKTKAEEIEAHNAIARKKIEIFRENLESACGVQSRCDELNTTEASLSCYQSESFQGARILTMISNGASTAKVELQASIENSKGNEEVCKAEAYTCYSQMSERANMDFNKCVKNNESKQLISRTNELSPITPSKTEEIGHQRHGILMLGSL
ncbi:uncharacterized protein LOC129952630 [Eupeodes corollae]|uniref:uncharacterized protein LOC129952630 n=1 Tax=Eupeodes corollae TaxID=290404 RepID=UPI002493A76E|nr:uncharacterized protein LOC129952630 [Eupeodes corollae]